MTQSETKAQEYCPGNDAREYPQVIDEIQSAFIEGHKEGAISVLEWASSHGYKPAYYEVLSQWLWVDPNTSDAYTAKEIYEIYNNTNQ
jgi:hypothetical protein